MKWFGSKAGRETARPFLVRWGAGTTGEAWPRSYEAQVREAYLANPVAQRAVRLVFDTRHSVVVALLHDGMWLQGRSDLALTAGDNAALLGDEIVQFGRAEALGGGRFRLSRLLRGRRGTEWAAGLHEPGERFVLLAPTDLRQIAAPLPALGTEVALMARGTGDGAVPPASISRRCPPTWTARSPRSSCRRR